jgi:hypothetical protein
MSWNYRVIRDLAKVHSDEGSEEQAVYSIREVYYDDDGGVKGWTEEPCDPFGESWLELSGDHAMMGRALALPVVDVTSGQPVERPIEVFEKTATRGGPLRDDDPVPAEETFRPPRVNNGND